MLIGNFKSIQDMDNKKRLQAELLQIAIDNEKIKEKRVSDYKNPNKPPPVPPQYRTNAEIQEDAMEQQKMVIDNLRSLGLDYQLSAQISQNLKNDIAGGDGNFLKFNKNFPYFKEKIEKNFNPKSATSSEIMEKIQEYFDDIDNSMGLALAGTKSTTFFSNKPLNAVSILASSQMYSQSEVEVDAMILAYGLNPATVAQLKGNLTNLINEAPDDGELLDIDAFPNVEKTKINRMIGTLIDKFNFPTSTFINDFNNSVGGIASPIQAQVALASLSNNIGMVNANGINKIRELRRKIREEQAKIANIVQLLAPPAPPPPPPAPLLDAYGNPIVGPVIHQPVNLAGVPINIDPMYLQNRQDAKDYVRSQLSIYANPQLIGRLTAPQTQTIDGVGVYANFFKEGPPTIDNNAWNGWEDERDNRIFELVKPTQAEILQSQQAHQIDPTQPVLENKFNNKANPVYQLHNGQAIPVGANFRYQKGGYDSTTQQWSPNGTGEQIIRRFTNILSIDRNTDNVKSYARMSGDEMKNIIRSKELPVIDNKIDNDPTYDPRTNAGSRIFAQNGTNAQIEGWGVKKRIKVGKGPERYERREQIEQTMAGNKWGQARGSGMKKYDSSSDEEEKIHIDINSHNGGFIKRRIKVGKGIEINKDEPKFRSFGKYIIHMAQLHNNNVLNFKHKSGGTIPSIKPVEINENFKDFIIDVLDSGRVNDRHYTSLTEPEKNHFLKAVRGAGIIEHIKLKQSNHDAEKEEMDRLELLLGEINAGNDNEKMIKEAKTLIKKYVSNGRISRQKGFDMLAELG